MRIAMHKLPDWLSAHRGWVLSAYVMVLLSLVAPFSRQGIHLLPLTYSGLQDGASLGASYSAAEDFGLPPNVAYIFCAVTPVGPQNSPTSDSNPKEHDHEKCFFFRISTNVLTLAPLYELAPTQTAQINRLAQPGVMPSTRSIFHTTDIRGPPAA